MTRNIAVFIVALSIYTFGCVHCQYAIAQPVVPKERPAQPNIIFVMADQLRFQSCGYAGDEKAHTPNLDQLAASGDNFRQAVSAMPVCSAYRASLLTGKYTGSTGMVINELRMNTNHNLFEDVEFSVPANYSRKKGPYGDGWSNYHHDPKKIGTWKRFYYAMTANLDWNVGRLLKAVDQAGIGENTVTVFTSDHGEMLGAHGRMMKNIFYEEAARVPFLIRWPARIPKGHVSDAPMNTVDVMPTLLSFADVPVPKEVEGTDLSHIAMNEKGPEPEFAFLMNTGACAAWEDGHEWRALRSKQYTYAVFRGWEKRGLPRKELLFDNIADPLQMHNLAVKPEYEKVLADLREKLKEKMMSLGDTFPASTWYRDNWIRKQVNQMTAFRSKHKGKTREGPRLAFDIEYDQRSEDRGKTWKVLPGKRHHGWFVPEYGRMDEGRVISIGNGEVFLMTRTPEGHLCGSRSFDDGKTWSKFAPTSLVHPDEYCDTLHIQREESTGNTKQT